MGDKSLEIPPIVGKDIGKNEVLRARCAKRGGVWAGTYGDVAMRLICPNCDAEYEVDAAAIPDGGRDVQCSACGHSWFQLPPGALAEKEDEAALFDPPVDVTAPEEPPSEEEAVPGHPAEASSPEPEGEAAGEAVPPAKVGRSLDESLMAVLRDEAERESAARRAEGVGLETQTEMPLAGSTPTGSAQASADETVGETASKAAAETAAETTSETAAKTADEVAARTPADSADEPAAGASPELGPATAAMRKIAKLRGQAVAPPAGPAEAESGADSGSDSAAPAEEGSARRERLPEIDEINSTLRAASEKRRVDEGAVAHTIKQARAPRGGFRGGFLTVMVLVILGAALYIAAPFVADRVPALQPALMAYLHAVDGLRIGLDALVGELSTWVKDVTGGKS